MSAIDWLRDSALVAPAPPSPPPVADPGPAAEGDGIVSAPLGGPRLDALGLVALPAAGLPQGLWSGSEAAALAPLLAADLRDLPAPARDLLYLLLLAEADPPAPGPEGDGSFLTARIDRLVAMGAVEPALALIDIAGPATPALARRGFELALLLDAAEQACGLLAGRGARGAGLAAAIYCLAREGEWQAAAITFRTAVALGELDPLEEGLLALFLDESGEAELLLPPPPAAPTPLQLRLYEAVGEPLATDGLPLAFAHADLGPNAGWRAQLVAAERLARTGAIPPNRLLGVYSERAPAASGGLWERVRAVQALDAALARGDTGAVAAALPGAWSEMAAAGLAPALASLFGEAVAGLALEGEAGALAFRLALLSPVAAAAAPLRRPGTAEEAFLAAVALGRPETAEPPGPFAAALRDGLTQPPPAAPAAAAAEGRAGEAILDALARIDAAARGDARAASEGLAALRALGLEEAARRIALHLLILGPRG